MKTTKFLNVHKKLNAKLVEFAGYEMPVQYSSIIDEHKAVRNSVGVFDVSHMGEIFVRGAEAAKLVQYMTTNNSDKLTDKRVQYSAMCYEDGGIVDDLLVYRFSPTEFMMVVNASNKDKDYEWIVKNNDFDADVTDESDEYSLLAVQGPDSKKTISKICETSIDNLDYYHFIVAKIAGVEMIVSRTGYTGEIGYELYFKGDENTAEKVWNAIFEAGEEFNIKPVGLGARDSLRLEMGFCLYGNDIDNTTNPLEAGLGWITKLKKGDFIGHDALTKIKEQGITRKLVPIKTSEKAFPRHGYELKVNGSLVGHVTSGTVSPVLNQPIALGYVNIDYAEENNTIDIIIRNKEVPAKIVKLPFVVK